MPRKQLPYIFQPASSTPGRKPSGLPLLIDKGSITFPSVIGNCGVVAVKPHLKKPAGAPKLVSALLAQQSTIMAKGTEVVNCFGAQHLLEANQGLARKGVNCRHPAGLFVDNLGSRSRQLQALQTDKGHTNMSDHPAQSMRLLCRE